MTELSLPEESIFLQALDRESAAERAAYLDQVCGDNEPLRAQVEALLRASQKSGDLFDRRESADQTIDRPITEQPGTVIGPYKLLQKIGEGGMGVVFMAEQTEPIQRTVALKIIKPGMDTRQVIARFEAERQAVAMMDHPNIAKVLDAGTTDSGRPYFVMELVKGVPITKYCDEKHMSLRARLELFVQVCQAVQHAHQKGIIHRDIKPNNVLVAEYDNRAVPKVIDFGVAKATAHRLTERTMFTEFGQVLGTMEYMSPEQSKFNQLDIDTRSDIYSLGVLLYELLAGSTPFEGKRLKDAAFDEMLRIIREEEPPKPSTRLSSIDTLPSVAVNRHTEPARLSKDVQGELDWIVMKALEKDRNRRYETASGFAADIERHLHDEPVEAGPPSAAYRFRKFAKRNKAALVTSTLALVAVLLVAATAGWAVRDRAGRRATVAARAEQVMGESETLYRQRKLPEAVQVARSALALVDGGAGGPAPERRAREWLKDLDMVARLEEINPRNDVHPVRKLGEYTQAFREYGIDIEALTPEEAAAQIKASSIWLDLVVALDRWANYLFTYGFHLGLDGEKRAAALGARLRQIARLTDPDPIRNRLRDSFAPVPPPGITDRGPMRNRLREDGKLDAAEMRRIAASVDVATTPIATLMMIGDAQPQWSDKVAFFTRVQRQHPSDFGVTFYLGRLLKISGDSDNAIRYLTAALSIRPQSVFTRQELGRALIGKGLVDEGIAQLEEASRLAPHAISKSRYQLEIGSRLMGKPGSEEKSAAALREAIRLAPDAAETHMGVGHAFFGFRRHDDALAAFREAVRLKPEHAPAHYMCCVTLCELNKLDEALAACREAIRLDPADYVAHEQLGIVLEKKGLLDEDIAVYREAVRLQPDHANANSVLAASIGWALVNRSDPKLRDPKRAVELGKEAVELAPQSAWNWQLLGWVQYRAGNWKASIEALEESCKLQNGGDCCQWFVMSLAHGKLANEKELTEQVRAQHQAEARRWYDQAVKQLDSWGTGGSSVMQATRAFRAEAAELLGVKEKQD